MPGICCRCCCRLARPRRLPSRRACCHGLHCRRRRPCCCRCRMVRRRGSSCQFVQQVPAGCIILAILELVPARAAGGGGCCSTQLRRELLALVLVLCIQVAVGSCIGLWAAGCVAGRSSDVAERAGASCCAAAATSAAAAAQAEPCAQQRAAGRTGAYSQHVRRAGRPSDQAGAHRRGQAGKAGLRAHSRVGRHAARTWDATGQRRLQFMLNRGKWRAARRATALLCRLQGSPMQPAIH